MSAALAGVQPVLMSSDVARSLRFYARLGFAAVFRDRAEKPRYAAVRRDGVELHLQWQDEAQFSAPVDRPTYRFPVDDVDGLFAELRDRGVAGGPASAGSPWAAPGDTPWGTREFHLRDPDGNGLQFYRPLGPAPAAPAPAGAEIAAAGAPAPAVKFTCPILRVADLEASLEHYENALGFAVDWHVPKIMASVSRDRGSLMLCEGDQGHPGAWVWIGVRDVEPLFAEFGARGARIRHPPTNYPWAYELQVEDPDGNVLRFGSEPRSDLPFGEWLDMHGRVWPPSGSEP